MECVRVYFAPDTEAWRAKNLLRRAVRGVNRLGVWPALYPDFFAFAEVPVEEDADAPELPEGAAESPACGWSRRWSSPPGRGRRA